MFKIGEFSRLAQVPVKTLRYYDEIGLLKPAKVDESTGYRYYSADQLPRLHRILALRDLGFSLRQIARFLSEELSPAELRGMLRLRQAELQEQAKEAQARLNRVAWRLRQIEEEGTMPMYEVVVKKVPATKAAVLREVIPTYSEVGRLFSEIFAHLRNNRVRPVGPPFATYYDEEYREQDVDVEAAVPIESFLHEGERIKVREVPGVEEMACLVHQGSYESVGEAYTHLISWIQANGYRICGPSREVYLKGPESGCDPAEYVTEVQFPVERA